MKKLLLFTMLMTVGSYFSLQAQPCHFRNIGVKINAESPGPNNTCIVNFDMYFDIQHNSGGKYFWFHVWPSSLYTNHNYTEPPTLSNGGLTNSILTFGFDHFQKELIPLTTYFPDTAAPGFQSDYKLSEIEYPDHDRYTVEGLTLTLPQDCNISQPLIADAWQSQSNNTNNIHCSTTQQPFILNDPTITGGLLFCAIPREYKFEITTTSVDSRTVTYKVIIDNGDGLFNAVTDTLIIGSGTESISASAPFQSGRIGYLPYSNLKPYSDRALWVIIIKNATDIPNDIYARIQNTCIPLPVQFSSFTATRVKETVLLRWATASEYNNRGFYIERKDANKDWVQLGFVNTAAGMGNSNEKLEYSYTDLNNTEVDLCQYRLRQVDMDGKFTYSQVRAVNGITQLNKVMVFPNPSANGEFTVILNGNDKGADLRLYDMNGKEVRTWTQVSGDRTRIFGIPDGLYMLKVIFHDRAEVVTTKIMISR